MYSVKIVINFSRTYDIEDAVDESDAGYLATEMALEELAETYDGIEYEAVELGEEREVETE